MTKIARFAWAAVTVLVSALCYSSSVPEASFPGVTGQVYAALVRDGRLFIGGDFHLDNPLGSATNLAEIDFTIDTSTGFTITKVSNGDADGPVYALALSSKGDVLYAGGDFASVGVNASDHTNLAAFKTADMSLVDWRLDTDGTVRALALAQGDSVLYVGGDFTQIGPVVNGTPNLQDRHRLAAVATASSTVQPWNPDVDDSVRALAVDGAAGYVYAGGDFNTVGVAPRPRLAKIGMASGLATPWAPAIAGARVDALALSGDTLYAGGSFTQAGGQPRNNVAALTTTTNINMAVQTWDPNANGEVLALTLTPDGLRLYAGGLFTAVNNPPVARAGIAAIPPAANDPIPIVWNPGADSTITGINALAIGDQTVNTGTVDEPAAGVRTKLFAGGDFTRIGGTDVEGLAEFDVSAPETSADPVSGAHQALSGVTLTCNDRSGAGCLQTCYAVTAITGSEPAFPGAYTCVAGASASVSLASDSTLWFASQDNDGDREPVAKADYVLDVTPPVTTIEPGGDLYGIDDIVPVTLACDDPSSGKFESACKIYYTLDGTSPATTSGGAPSTTAVAYTGAISLSDLFPPPGIPEDEVDPLLHKAGEVTVSAFSIDAANNASSVVKHVYFVDLAAPVVTASLPGGSYTPPQTVTLNCNDGVGSGCDALYYTTDNTQPAIDNDGNPISPTRRYTQPLELSSATALTVMATDKAKNHSTALVGVYAFSAPSNEGHSGVGAVDGWWLALLLAGLAARSVIRSYRP